MIYANIYWNLIMFVYVIYNLCDTNIILKYGCYYFAHNTELEKKNSL